MTVQSYDRDSLPKSYYDLVLKLWPLQCSWSHSLMIDYRETAAAPHNIFLPPILLCQGHIGLRLLPTQLLRGGSGWLQCTQIYCNLQAWSCFPTSHSQEPQICTRHPGPPLHKAPHALLNNIRESRGQVIKQGDHMGASLNDHHNLQL